jgi:DNA gyrase subunit A
MGFPIPEFPDGLHPSVRKLIGACQSLCRDHQRGCVKTRKVLEKVRASDLSRSFLELYADILRLAQPWIVRYPLYETQGDFGSIDGNPPCGASYNEIAPSSWISTVGSAFPQLLVNGGFGHTGTIESVAPPGGADPEFLDDVDCHVPAGRVSGGELRSFLPPHNLREVAAALLRLVDSPDSTLSEIREVLPGPDFPTGGLLANPEDLDQIYRSGSGSLVLRARTRIDTDLQGERDIELTQIPYGVTATQVIEKAAEYVRAYPDLGITDIRDFGSRDGLQIQFKLRKGHPPQSIIDYFVTRGIFENKVEVRMVVMKEGQEARVGLMDLLRSHLEQRRLHLRSDSKLREELKVLASKSDERRTVIAGRET